MPAPTRTEGSSRRGHGRGPETDPSARRRGSPRSPSPLQARQSCGPSRRSASGRFYSAKTNAERKRLGVPGLRRVEDEHGEGDGDGRAEAGEHAERQRRDEGARHDDEVQLRDTPQPWPVTHHQHRDAGSGECSRLKAQCEAEGMPQVKFLCALVIMPGRGPSQGQPHWRVTLR